MEKSLTKENEPKIKEDCVDDSAKAMPFALGAMFIREGVENESAKNLAEIMAESIREAFKENLSNLDYYWVDDRTRNLLQDKVNAVTALIGKYFPAFHYLNNFKFFFSNFRISCIYIKCHKARSILRWLQFRSKWIFPQ